MAGDPQEKALTERGSGASAGYYDSMLTGAVRLLEDSRLASARAVNAVMTATYWEVGRRIVEGEQAGAKRAGYGRELLKRLSSDLTAKFGRGFSVRALRGVLGHQGEVGATSAHSSSVMSLGQGRLRMRLNLPQSKVHNRL